MHIVSDLQVSASVSFLVATPQYSRVRYTVDFKKNDRSLKTKTIMIFYPPCELYR